MHVTSALQAKEHVGTWSPIAMFVTPSSVPGDCGSISVSVDLDGVEVTWEKAAHNGSPVFLYFLEAADVDKGGSETIYEVRDLCPCLHPENI